MITPVFKTARSSGDYKLSVNRHEDGKIHVAIDAGATGIAIVLTNEQAEGLTKALAGQLFDSGGVPPHEPSTCGTAYLGLRRRSSVLTKENPMT